VLSVHRNEFTIWLMGGLGNQLFQVNYGLSLSARKKIPVVFNTYLLRRNIITRFLRWTIHDYILDQLIEVKSKFVSKSNLNVIMASRLPVMQNFSSFYGVHGAPDSDCKNIFGYFQNRSFIENAGSFINLKPGLLSSHPKYETVMHLRVGDLNEPGYAACYYDRLLHNIDPSKIHVVTNRSNDLLAFQEKFTKHSFINVSDRSDYDFLTCCNADRLLVAPSTFSWWAARLGRQKEVILPEQTFDAIGKPCVNPQTIQGIL